MNAILYMTLTANGRIFQPDERHSIPKEILGNFGQLLSKTGNLINGRRTFELMRDQNARSRFSGIEVVVVSHTPLLAEGYQVAGSPREALNYLAQKGFETAIVGGGAQLDYAFLSHGMVDELYLNIEPIIANKGIPLVADEGFETSLHLIDTAKLSDDIIQLHYTVENK